MDNLTLEFLQSLIQIAAQADAARDSIEKFFVAFRRQFVFDNVAVYLHDERSASLEIVYARAVGRERSAEADAAWGETFAARVFAQDEIMMQEPNPAAPAIDRLQRAYLLGLPLGGKDSSVRGALAFVRFGGPLYESEHIQLATTAVKLLTILYERFQWKRANAALNDLKRQMQLQEDFVSAISHELRTPLGFIKGYSTSLLRKDAVWDEATRDEFLTIIDEETDRLGLLIENMLESARLQSKTLPLRFQPLRLDAILRDVIDRIQSRYKDLNVRVEIESTPSIYGDGVRIAQVLENLFMNAIKYAPAAPIVVSLSTQGGTVQLAFRDQGPGIAPEALPLLFDRFFRARNEQNISGSGLGLYICKQIIEAHHGKIWVESTLGKGSSFFIELPINLMK